MLMASTIAMKNAVAIYSPMCAAVINRSRRTNNAHCRSILSRRAGVVCGWRCSPLSDLRRSESEECLLLMPPIRMAVAEIITAGVTAVAIKARDSSEAVAITLVLGLHQNDCLRFGRFAFAHWSHSLRRLELNRNRV